MTDTYATIEHHARLIEREAQRLRDMAAKQPAGIDPQRLAPSVALDIIEHALQMSREVK